MITRATLRATGLSRHYSIPFKDCRFRDQPYAYRDMFSRRHYRSRRLLMISFTLTQRSLKSLGIAEIQITVSSSVFKF